MVCWSGWLVVDWRATYPGVFWWLGVGGGRPPHCVCLCSGLCGCLWVVGLTGLKPQLVVGSFGWLCVCPPDCWFGCLGPVLTWFGLVGCLVGLVG